MPSSARASISHEHGRLVARSYVGGDLASTALDALRRRAGMGGQASATGPLVSD